MENVYTYGQLVTSVAVMSPGVAGIPHSVFTEHGVVPPVIVTSPVEKREPCIAQTHLDLPLARLSDTAFPSQSAQ